MEARQGSWIKMSIEEEAVMILEKVSLSIEEAKLHSSDPYKGYQTGWLEALGRAFSFEEGELDGTVPVPDEPRPAGYRLESLYEYSL